ncbi:hypothetical protein E2C01_086952 [Portunus trituberculatus]|uniref:Uncharacterized protein n=1 Tax=Portunus trituberculatus TaxID=210409 RepID=A0A5B7J586_PORTR|nr:hypothetical protein [Portunus trituberculatus]
MPEELIYKENLWLLGHFVAPGLGGQALSFLLALQHAMQTSRPLLVHNHPTHPASRNFSATAFDCRNDWEHFSARRAHKTKDVRHWILRICLVR